MHLSEAGPHHIIGLSGQQHDILQPDLPFQAVEIIKGIAVFFAAQKFKFLLVCPDTGLLKQLPGDGLAAGLPCQSCAAGIFPGAGKALSLGPSGQQLPRS